MKVQKGIKLKCPTHLSPPWERRNHKWGGREVPGRESEWGGALRGEPNLVLGKGKGLKP